MRPGAEALAMVICRKAKEALYMRGETDGSAEVGTWHVIDSLVPPLLLPTKVTAGI